MKSVLKEILISVIYWTSFVVPVVTIRYSKLIQECFAELTDPVLQIKGQIYHYVGDEAVITWEK
jgi:adenylate cyclase